METRCPQCRTVFRVAEEQLAVADGVVRCGECEQVFNAREQATETSVTSSNKHSRDAITIDIPEVHAADIHLETPELDMPEGFRDWPATNPNAPPGNEPANQDEADSAAAVPDATQVNEATSPDVPSDATAETEAPEVATATPRRPESGYDVTALYPELDKVPPIQPPPSPRATLGWSLAILLILGVLFGQLAYFMRDKLARNPNLRPLLETMCESLACTLGAARAPAQIRLVEHKVLSHPKSPEGLRVEAVISNEAGFNQPYPLLRLRFHDLDGHLLATRDFLPEQYLPTDVDLKAGMTAGEPVNAVLDIIDPGKKAISYEFDFL